MKKCLSFILLLSLSFAFFSCGGDDDNPTPPEPKPEPFVWGGDWNDPDDAAYKPEYKGKYNPIQGLWRNTKYKERGFYFSEGFRFHDAAFSLTSNRYVIEGKGLPYIINDKAMKYGSVNMWQYRIEGDRMLFYSYNDTPDKGVYYTRAEE